MGSLAQHHRAERVRHDEAAILRYQPLRKIGRHGKGQPVAEFAVLAPFAVAAEIGYRRFHLDDQEDAIAAHGKKIGAPPVGERHLGEARIAQLRQRASRAAANILGDVAWLHDRRC